MQDAAIVLCLKIVLVSGFVSLVAWIALYTRLADWWANPFGRTLVAKAALIAALFIPTALSLFFHLSARDSRITGWADVALIGLVTPVMWWRALVFLRMGPSPRRRHDRAGRPSQGPGQESGAGGAP